MPSTTMSRPKCVCPKTCMSGRSLSTRSFRYDEPTAFANMGAVRYRFSGLSSNRGRKCENVRTEAYERRFRTSSASSKTSSLTASTAWATLPSSMLSGSGHAVSAKSETTCSGARTPPQPSISGSVSHCGWCQDRSGTTRRPPETPGTLPGAVSTPRARQSPWSRRSRPSESSGGGDPLLPLPTQRSWLPGTKKTREKRCLQAVSVASTSSTLFDTSPARTRTSSVWAVVLRFAIHTMFCFMSVCTSETAHTLTRRASGSFWSSSSKSNAKPLILAAQRPMPVTLQGLGKRLGPAGKQTTLRASR
mmetsp:Transcript_66703/g.198492  ORF Transcript_66703/g.198492 Transcript_66703/m.198492 type:complete len:305 (+) Transcript_66703:275-1189(+)